MKQTLYVEIGMIALLMAASCNRPAKKSNIKYDPYPVKYENELFSVSLPYGWTYDNAGWNGLDSINNTVDFEDASGESPIWIHVVKTFFPLNHQYIKQAIEMAKMARKVSGSDCELIYEEDSTTVSGYPAGILYFANYVDNDTIIQRQFVTYLPDSHITMYINLNCYINDWDYAMEKGDEIIRQFKIKKVKNPLDDNDKFKKVVLSHWK